MKKVIFILLLLVLTFVTLNPVSAKPNNAISGTSIWVNTGLDVIIGSDGLCSLREAVIAANTDTASGGVSGECEAGDGVDTIILGVRTHLLTIDGTGLDNAAIGDLDIQESVNVYGLGKTLTIIEQDIADRIFHVQQFAGNVTLRIEDLMITEGIVNNDGGAAVQAEEGLLIVEDVIFKNNLVVGTESGAVGGAIEAKDGLQIVNCLFDNNYANRGGAVFVAGGVTGGTIEKSLFLDNDAQSGGALTNYGDITIENTTFSHNRTVYSGGGAISNAGTLTIAFSTLVGNTSNGSASLVRGGALFNASDSTITVRSTILAENSVAANPDENNCNQGGTWETASQFNLEDDDTCPLGVINFYNTDPRLGPLGFYGGPTQTYPVLHDSPAIDSGNNSGCPDEDQRSFARPIDGNDNAIATCDIGAFESDAHYDVVYLPLQIK